MFDMLSFCIQDYTLRLVLIGIILLSSVTSTLGVFVLLRRQSLLSDAIAHASLPGLTLAFLITHSRHPLVLLCGATISGSIGTMLAYIIEHKTKLKKDTILGIILSVFFGIGLMLMTVIQRSSIANKALLHKILFGNIATILPSDIYAIACITFVVFVSLAFFWKDFVALVFDYEYAHSIGYPVHILNILLTALLIITVVIGLQIVGIMLMSSMIIAPAAAAYQWCTRIPSMALLALGIGISAGIFGAVISCIVSHLPTGPVIVVILNTFVALSIMFGKKRGIIWKIYHRYKKVLKTDELA